jgi:hypothetical protein
MRKNWACWVVVAVLSVVVAGVAQAQVQIYTDRAAWEAAVHGIYSEEQFTDAALNADISVTTTNGFVDTTLGLWHDVIDGSQTTTFTFSTLQSGFGGTWNLAGPGGSGTGIAVETENGSTYLLPYEIPNSIAGTFWGFTTPFAFRSVTLLEGSQLPGVETYELDDMVYAPQDAIAVPVLSIAGLVALACLLAVAAIVILRR